MYDVAEPLGRRWERVSIAGAEFQCGDCVLELELEDWRSMMMERYIMRRQQAQGIVYESNK